MMRGRIFAKRYAEMGLEVARHPAIQQDDPLLHFSSNDGGGYNVTLVAEEARLNINHLLQTGDKVLLRRLFTRWGFKPEFTAALCDALKDWVDAMRTSASTARKSASMKKWARRHAVQPPLQGGGGDAARARHGDRERRASRLARVVHRLWRWPCRHQ
jgi:hypothetical protein